MKPQILLAAVLSLSQAAPALADPCRDEIAALFDGGALDIFAQPPYRAEMRVLGPDGAEKQVFDWVVETPVRQLFGMRGGTQYMLHLGAQSWMGPGPEGPWTALGEIGAGGTAEAQRAVGRSQQANLQDTECPGVTERDGTAYLTYSFRTRTDPDPARGDSWFSGAQTILIDPGTGLLMIREEREMAGSWAPEPSPDTRITTYAYDPALVLETPGE